jgi:hypothetical protein
MCSFWYALLLISTHRNLSTELDPDLEQAVAADRSRRVSQSMPSRGLSLCQLDQKFRIYL